MDIANLIIRVTNEGLDRATRELRRLQDNAQGAQAANKKFGESIADLNKLALVGFGALTAVVGGSIKTAIDFEKAMAGVAKTVDFATDNGLANMKKGIEDLTKVIPLAFEELAEIAAIGGQLGVAEDDILGFTETIAKMGVAFDMSADVAADSMAKIAGVFGIPIAEISALGDSINAVSNSVAATAGDVIEFMKRVGGTSGALKISADNTSALGGAMVALGLTPEVAGTAFNALGTTLAGFNNLTSTQARGFKRLGLDTVEFADLIQTDAVAAIHQLLGATKELGGTDALTALTEAFGAQGIKILQVAEGLDTVDLALSQVAIDANGVSAAFGSMDAEFASVSGTTANKLQLVQNNMRLLAAGVGEAFLPAVNEMILALVPVIEKMTAWAQANPELIRQIVLVAGALTGSIIAIATISGAIGTAIGAFQGVAAIVGVAITVFKALLSPIILIQSAIAHLWPVFVALTSPIGLAVLAIAALIAIGVVLYKNWDTIKEKAAELWQSVVAAWDGLVAGTSAAWDGIKASISGAWDSIVSVISGVWDSITSSVSAGWQAIVYAFENPKETILNILSSMWDNFKAGVEAVFTLAVKIFIGGWIEIFKTAVQFKDDLIQTVVSIKDGAVSGFHALVDGAINLWHDLVSSTKAIWQGLISGAIAMIDGIKSAVTSGINAIKDFFSGGWRDVWNDLKVKLVGMVQSVMDAMTNFAKSVANGMVKVKTTVIEKMTEVLSWLRELPSKVFTIGLDFAKGFVNGIKAIGSGVLDAAKSMASGAVNIVKKEIDSHSPSKVTTKLGGDFSQGFINGIVGKSDDVKKAAIQQAQSAIDGVKGSIATLQKQIALFGNNSSLASLLYDIENTDKYKDVSDQLVQQLVSETTALERLNAQAKAALSIQDSIDGLIKQQALFGNSSSLASLMYDIEHTEKYKNITQELKDELIAQTKAFEQLGMTAKATQAIQERFAQLGKDKEASQKAVDGVMSEIANESPLGKIKADYKRRLDTIAENELLITGVIGSAEAERLAVKQVYMDATQKLMLDQSEAIFGGLAGMAKGFLGEQSGIYRALYTMQKMYTLSSAVLSSKKAIMDAWANTPGTYFTKALAAGKVVLSTSAITNAISGLAPQGFKQGGYTGNMGASQVAGVVHGQEYVFDAQSTKRIGVDNLNAMRRGDSPKGGGDVNISVNVDAKGNSSVQGDNERMGRDMANGIKAVVLDVMRKEKRQGGMLYA